MEENKDYIKSMRKLIGNGLLFVPGVRALIIDEKDRILLQLRTDFDLWGLPSGSPKLYEKTKDCLIREVNEETGLTCSNFDCIGYSSNPIIETITYPNGDKIRCFSLLFLVKKWSGELIVSNDETKEIKFFNFENLPVMIPNHKKSVQIYKNYIQYKEFQCE